MSTATDIYGALHAANLSYSAMSWSGFNLFGDQPSIDELKRLVHEVGNIEAYWRPNHIRMQEQLAKGPPLAWFRQSSQNPKAWYQIDAADVKMHKDRGDVVRAVYE